MRIYKVFIEAREVASLDDKTGALELLGFYQTFWIPERSAERASAVAREMVENWILENDARDTDLRAEVEVLEVQVAHEADSPSEPPCATGRVFYPLGAED